MIQRLSKAVSSLLRKVWRLESNRQCRKSRQVSRIRQSLTSFWLLFNGWFVEILVNLQLEGTKSPTVMVSGKWIRFRGDPISPEISHNMPLGYHTAGEKKLNLHFLRGHICLLILSRIPLRSRDQAAKVSMLHLVLLHVSTVTNASGF